MSVLYTRDAHPFSAERSRHCVAIHVGVICRNSHRSGWDEFFIGLATQAIYNVSYTSLFYQNRLESMQYTNVFLFYSLVDPFTSGLL